MKTASISAVVLAFALAGCGQPTQTVRSSMSMPQQVSSDASQAARLPQQPLLDATVVMHAQYDVQAVNVMVPRTLQVSEANTFLPKADIVWRGDAPGNRYEQVKAIFDAAMLRGTAAMHSGPKVVVDIEVTRFHCLTEKTRFTVGGVHSMHFLLTVRDAATGAILQGPRPVVADIKAAGGSRALAEDYAGRTQKVVVTERLAEVIRRELSAPVASYPSDVPLTRFDGSPADLVQASAVVAGTSALN